MSASEHSLANFNSTASLNHQQFATSMEEIPLWLLVELANELSTATSLEALQGILSHKLRWIISYNCCTLAVQSQPTDTEYLIFDITSPSKAKSISPQKIPLDQGWCGRAIATSKPYFLADINQLPSSITTPLNAFIGIAADARSLMLLPLRNGERTIGSLNFSSNTPNTYSVKWRTLASLLAFQVAGQISSVLAQEQTSLVLKALAVSQAKLKSAYEFRERVMESATDAIFALDLEGNFTLANRRTAEMIGYSVEALLGFSFLELFSPAEANNIQNQLSAIVDQGVAINQCNAVLIGKDGTQQMITFSLAPIFLEGEISAVVGMAQSIRF